MPTLDIGGRKVNIGDEFLKLSPEQQNSTVEEIAKSLPAASGPKGLGEAIKSTFANPDAPVPGQVSIPLPGGRQFKPSLIGMAKAAWEGITAPGNALKGDFSETPETPGQLTEADVERQRMAGERERAAAGKLAGTLTLGQAPGGIFAAPKGALGSGFARPGSAINATLSAEDIAALGQMRASGATTEEAIQFLRSKSPPEAAAAGGANPPGPPGAPPAGAPPAPGSPPPPAAGPAPAASPLEVVEAGQRIDVPIPRYMVDESRMTQGLAAGLQNIPGAGDKIAKAAETTTKALGNAADRVREGYGMGSPAVGGNYAKDALTDWMTTGSSKVASRVYDKVDDLVKPEVATELTATARAAQTILDRRSASKIPGRSAAVDTVLDAATTPGGLNYQGIKGLRTFVGEMTPEELVSQGLKASEVKQLYGALTQDLRTAVFEGGGVQALSAFSKANKVFESIAQRREALQKIVGSKGDAAPEAVFARLTAMAGSKSSADVQRLLQARKAMGPEAWNEVAGAVVARLGRDPQGDFSIQRFLTAWGNVSPVGKNILFRSTGKDMLAKSLDDIAFVTKQIEDKLKQFHNPSGTGKSVASTETVMGILHSPIKTLTTILGGSKMAKVLSEPATARAAADWSKAYGEAIMAPHIGARSKAVRDAAEQLAGLITRQTGGNPQILAAQLQFNALGENPTAH